MQHTGAVQGDVPSDGNTKHRGQPGTQQDRVPTRVIRSACAASTIGSTRIMPRSLSPHGKVNLGCVHASEGGDVALNLNATSASALGARASSTQHSRPPRRRRGCCGQHDHSNVEPIRDPHLGVLAPRGRPHPDRPGTSHRRDHDVRAVPLARFEDLHHQHYPLRLGSFKTANV